MLAVAVAAGHVGVVVHHAIPEEFRRRAVVLGAGQFVACGKPHQLRDLRVGVFAGEHVFPAGERIENRLMVKPSREHQIARVAGVGVEGCQHLVHAAMLAGEDLLHLLLVQAGQGLLIPVCQAARDLQRVRVAGQPIRVPQSGKHLVLGVVRHPKAVEIEARRADVAGRDFGERLAAACECCEIAVTARALAFSQLGDDVVHPFEKTRIAGGGPGEGATAQVVPERMAGDGLAFPSAVILSLRRKPGFDAETAQQAV